MVTSSLIGQRVLLKARLLSISTDENFSSNWPNKMELPAIEVLVLHFKSKNYSLPPCMEKMDSLKTSIVSNNVFLPAELGNLPLLHSLLNLKRLRLERVIVPFFDMSWGHLKNLEKVSFFMCNINQELPTSVEVHEALPNLVEVDISYCNDLVKLPNGIWKVVSLMRLTIFLNFPRKLVTFLTSRC